MSIVLLNASEILSQLSYKGELIILNTVNSTNQYILDNIVYLRSGFVCLAEAQTHGRGRYGKYWFSPFNNNLYLSVYWLLSNYDKLKSITILSVVTSLVVCEVLQSLGIVGIQVKWPNDIYFQGCKLAGVLVEIITKFRNYIHVVIGVGINIVRVLKLLEDSVPIISLEEIGIFVDRNILAVKVINALYHSLVKFECSGFSPFLSRWLVLDYFYNRKVQLFIDNYVYLVVSKGVNFQGDLLIDRAGVMYSYSCIEHYISIRE